jgi:predicted nucleotidyltransferase
VEFERVLAIFRAFDEQQVEYVLIGGVALNLHGLVRATEDVDLFVRSDAANVEKIRRALRTIWTDPEIESITTADLSGDYSVVRYGPPGETLVVDLVSRIGTAFSFDDLDAENIEVEGVRVRVASPATLYRLKRDTVRPIDKADAAALKQKFALPENL